VVAFGEESSLTRLLEDLRSEKSRREKSQREDLEKQKYVAAQLAAVVECESRQDYAGAIALIRNAAQRYGELPQLAEAQARIERVQRLQREQKEQRVTAAIAFIERELAAGNWANAIEYSRRGIEQFPDVSVFVRLADLARQKKREAAEKLVTQGRTDLAAGRLEMAEKLLQTELRPHLQEPLVEAFVIDIKRERARRDDEQLRQSEKGAYISAQLTAIGKCESRQELNAARELVRRALERYPEAAELLLAQTRIEQAWRANQEQQVAGTVAAIEQELARGNWAQAIEGSRQAREQFPREPAFARLGEAASQKKREAAERLVSQGRQELMAGRLENAERLVQNELAPHIQEPVVKAFVSDLKLSRARHDEERRRSEERSSYVSAQLAAIAKLESRREWHAGLELVRRALERYSQSPELLSAQTRIVQALRAEQEMGISESLSRIKQELASGNWQPAIEQAEAASRRYPEEGAFVTTLKQGLVLKQRYMDREVSRARSFLRDGDIDQAEYVLSSLQPHAREVAVKALSVEIKAEKARLSELQKAEQREREFISAQLQRVATLEHKQDFPAAIRAVRKALLTYPDAPELKEKLQALENAAESAAKVDQEFRSGQAVAQVRAPAGPRKRAFGIWASAGAVAVLLSVTVWMAVKPSPSPPAPIQVPDRKKGEEAQRQEQLRRSEEEARLNDQLRTKEDADAKRAKEQADTQRAKDLADAKRAKDQADAKRAKDQADAQRAKEQADAQRAKEQADAQRAKEQADAKRAKELADAKRAKEQADAQRAKEEAQQRDVEEKEATRPWHGAPRGSVTWRGSLQPSTEISIGPGSTASEGQLTGVWPRTEVEVYADPPVFVRSNLLTVTVRNNTGALIPRIELHWKAKHPE